MRQERYNYVTTYTVFLHSNCNRLPNMPEHGDDALVQIMEAINAGAADCQIQSIEEFDDNGVSCGGIFLEENENDECDD